MKAALSYFEKALDLLREVREQELSAIDQAAASRAAGVYSIITPFNAPKITSTGNVNILQDTNVLFSGQPIAVVVARSLPEAEQAATA